MLTMTRSRMYVFTAIAALLYVGMGIAFADGMFTLDNFWTSDAWFGGTWLTYTLLAIIGVAGLWEARRLPDAGVAISGGTSNGEGQVDDPSWWKLMLGNTYLAVLWLPLRFFIGQEWLVAGEHKLRDSAWMDGGAALKGYWTGAVAIPAEEGARPRITYDWFRDFLQYMLDHEWYTWFAKLVAIGEFLVGLGLVVGALVGIAAFFGTVLNFNFMLAGTTSTNPVLFALTVFLVLGWKVAGWIGLDRYLLPLLGTPWKLGKVAGTHKDAPIIGGQTPHGTTI
jgi:thiosulfate dehydrogenase [quinone] large subunit